MKKFIDCITFFILLLACLPVSLFSISIGSLLNVVSSGPITFSSADNNNTIRGLVVLESGIILQDQLTSCTFDSYMQVPSIIKLSGGQLHLLQDLRLGNTSALIGGGSIYGNKNALCLPDQVGVFDLPNVSQADLNLAFIDSELMFSKVRSVSWSHDSLYLAGASDKTSSNNELKVYYFDGEVLTTTQSIEIGAHTYSAAWHPTKKYLALGVRSNSDDELQLYRLNISNGRMPLVDGRELGNRRVYAVEWHPSGDYLLIGKRRGGNDEIIMYSFNDTTGLLSELTTENLSPDRSVNYNAISFSPTGSQVAIGLSGSSSSGANELIIYNFDGSSLTESAGDNTNTSVYAVAWNAVHDEYIAAGLSGGSNRLRLFKYDAGAETLTHISSANVGETERVWSVHWHPSGEYLSVGIDDGINSRLDIYLFDPVAETLALQQSFAPVTAVYTTRWSPDGSYIAWGENGRAVSVAGQQEFPLLLDQLEIKSSGPVRLNKRIEVSGECCYNGNGNVLSFNDDALLVIKPNSTLHFENTQITHLKNNQLICTDDSAQVSFANCKVILDEDVTFSSGAALFVGDVILSGSHTFIYSSQRTMSIEHQSHLVLTNGLTLSVDPLGPYRNILHFRDRSAYLIFDGANLHVTYTGLFLSQGTILIDNNVTFSSEGRTSGEGIILDPSLTIGILGNGELSLEGQIIYSI